MWSNGLGSGTISSPTSPNSNISSLSAGLNTFIWSVSNGGCTAELDTVTITRDEMPTPSNAGADQTLCADASTFAANTPSIGSGNWALISGSGSATTPGSPTSALSGIGTGSNTFSWTISNGVCPASADTVTITRDEIPTSADAGADQVLCADASTFAANTPSVGSGNWALISGSGSATTPGSPYFCFVGHWNWKQYFFMDHFQWGVSIFGRYSHHHTR